MATQLQTLTTTTTHTFTLHPILSNLKPIQRHLTPRPMDNPKFWTHSALQIEGLDPSHLGSAIIRPFGPFHPRFALVPLDTTKMANGEVLKRNKGYAFIFFDEVGKRDRAVEWFRGRELLGGVVGIGGVDMVQEGSEKEEKEEEGEVREVGWEMGDAYWGERDEVELGEGEADPFGDLEWLKEEVRKFVEELERWARG